MVLPHAYFTHVARREKLPTLADVLHIKTYAMATVLFTIMTRLDAPASWVSRNERLVRTAWGMLCVADLAMCVAVHTTDGAEMVTTCVYVDVVAAAIAASIAAGASTCKQKNTHQEQQQLMRDASV